MRLKSKRASCRNGQKRQVDYWQDGKLAVIIKSVGKDTNNHEYFEVLLNDQTLMVWDDEIEKRDLDQ